MRTEVTLSEDCKPIITGIMACDLIGAIGKNNKLPWNAKEELEHFRKTTVGNVMIMGHRTYTAMPERALENRWNIVFSRTARMQIKENIVFVSSLQEFLILIKKLSKNSKNKIETGRFKGLGEMTPAQLKETTMHPEGRIMFRVNLQSQEEAFTIVNDLMGKKPEKRFEFIQNQALIKMENIINNLDI